MGSHASSCLGTIKSESKTSSSQGTSSKDINALDPTLKYDVIKK